LRLLQRRLGRLWHDRLRPWGLYARWRLGALWGALLLATALVEKPAGLGDAEPRLIACRRDCGAGIGATTWDDGRCWCRC
jgi:hypothetical protein